MPSVVAISATVTQRGCGVEIGRGSAAPITMRAKIFGRSTEFMLATTATDRSRQIAVEPSIPLAQNVFATHRTRASTVI